MAAVKNCWVEDTVLSPVLSRQRYRTLCHRWLSMAAGDVAILAHCEAPLLVNIAHIQKVNEFRRSCRDNRGYMQPLKKIRPRFPEARSYTAQVYIRPAAIVVSYRQGQRRCQIGRAHFISTMTFSVQLHKLHSKVRTSGTPSPDTTPVSIIGPWHFGHGGRSISMEPRSALRNCGMCCSPKIRREHDALCHR
jgi:hypothetical protein